VGCLAVAIQSFTIASNSAVVIPACVAMTISTTDCIPSAIAPSTLPSSSEAKGSVSCHSGCSGASALTRSSANRSWKYIGRSAHRVPSLSNTAMRSAGGTKSGEPFSVTLVTKSMIDCLALPSFQEGSDSTL
jgi:hypothetical protein